jgi:Cu/Ag efflux pump CusA
MWIVRLALRRPYTFVVMALLIAVLGIAAIVTMTVDIFPAINIPVVTVIWNYSGLSPTEMQNRIVTVLNAQIGVATAEFFPRFMLTSSAGFESANISTLFNWQSRVASISPASRFRSSRAADSEPISRRPGPATSKPWPRT